MEKKTLFNICNIYTVLWCFLHLKGFLYSNDYVSLSIYIIIVVISVYYTGKTLLLKNNPPFIKTYSVLFLLFFIYGVINILFFEPVIKKGHVFPTDFYLQNVIKSMLPFYAFYNFAKEGYICKKWLCVTSIIFIFVAIGRFFVGEDYAISLLSAENTDIEGVTNNAGYYFVALMPFACFWKKRIVSYAYLLVCSLFVIYCMKRGAMIAGIILLVVYFIGVNLKSSDKRILLNLALALVLAFIIYNFVMKTMMSNDFFIRRIDDTIEGGSSGRDFLFSFFWNMFTQNGNILNFLFGFGADSTIRYGANYAHNDWLEILLNQGVIGVIIFIIFWMKSFKFWQKQPRRTTLSIAVAMCLCLLFVRTIYSMSINDMEVYITCILGIAVAATKNNKLMSNLNI